MDRLRGRDLQIDPGFFLSQGLGPYFRFLALMSESQPTVFFRALTCRTPSYLHISLFIPRRSSYVVQWELCLFYTVSHSNNTPKPLNFVNTSDIRAGRFDCAFSVGGNVFVPVRPNFVKLGIIFFYRRSWPPKAAENFFGV